MHILNGRILSPGIASGKCRLIADCSFEMSGSGDSETEKVRLDAAISEVKDELSRLEAESEEDNPEAAAFFGIHRMMLEDPDYTDLLYAAVSDGASAAEAAKYAEDTLINLFMSSEDEILAARSADIKDITRRILNILSGKISSEDCISPAVIVGNEILPGDMLSGGVLAVIVQHGSFYSHTALLARSKGIPMIVCPELDLSLISDGMTVIVDGEHKQIILDPDAETLISVNSGKNILQTASQVQTVDLSELPAPILINIASSDDIASGILDTVCGVGLFRTEFLYIGRNELPDEELQTAAYISVLEAAKGKPVVIRTFDLGADKTAKALPVKPEENPALGLRGIRLSLSYPEVFKVQLRALLRAAVHGDLRIMYPMITSVSEIKAADRAVSEAAASLERDGIPYRIPPRGIMIETPAAVILSDGLAKECDFFSVGTNDLSQYTLALDRQNEEVETFADPGNEAVLRMIRIAADNAHKAGIHIGVCGDLASNPFFAVKLLSAGADYLSVSPMAVSTVEKALIS